MDGTLLGFQNNLKFIYYSSFGEEKLPRVSERALLLIFLILLGGLEIGSKRKHKLPNAYESSEENVHEFGTFII